MVNSHTGGSAAAAEGRKAPSAMAAARAALRAAGKLHLKLICILLAGTGVQPGVYVLRACKLCRHDQDTCRQLPLLTFLLSPRQRCCVLGKWWDLWSDQLLCLLSHNPVSTAAAHA